MYASNIGMCEFSTWRHSTGVYYDRVEKKRSLGKLGQPWQQKRFHKHVKQRQSESHKRTKRTKLRILFRVTKIGFIYN